MKPSGGFSTSWRGLRLERNSPGGSGAACSRPIRWPACLAKSPSERLPGRLMPSQAGCRVTETASDDDQRPFPCLGDTLAVGGSGAWVSAGEELRLVGRRRLRPRVGNRAGAAGGNVTPGVHVMATVTGRHDREWLGNRPARGAEKTRREFARRLRLTEALAASAAGASLHR
jgi:hypothetical protein